MDWYPYRILPQDLVPGPPKLFVIHAIPWIHLIISDIDGPIGARKRPKISNSLKFTLNIMIPWQDPRGELGRNWKVGLTRHIIIHGDWWHISVLQQIRALIEDFGPIRIITLNKLWPINRFTKNLINYPALILFRLLNRHTYYKNKEIIYNMKNWGNYRYNWKEWHVYNDTKKRQKVEKQKWRGTTSSLNFLF